MAGRFTCGTIVPSSCVPFTGKDLSFLTGDAQIKCDANIDDVIEKMSDKISDISDAINVSTYNLSCLQGVPNNPTIIDISKAQTQAICALTAQIDALSDQIAGLNIANEHISIDLGCLSPSASACQVSTNVYTLISILSLFKNEICAIKTELGI